MHNGFGLRTNQWAYMRYRDDSKELYDMVADPKQFTNLANRTEYAELIAEMDAALNQRIEEAELEN